MMGNHKWDIVQNGPNDHLIFDDNVQIAANTWYHIAVTRTAAGLYKMFQDGVLLTNSVGTNPLGSIETINFPAGGMQMGAEPTVMGMGGAATNIFSIDEFRITKGTAIDFASEGKPTQPYTCS